MKKIVEDLARKVGIETAYAGSTRTMYIKGPNLEHFRERIRNLYPNLAFQLKPTDRFLESSLWSDEAKKLKKSKSKKTPSMLVFSGTEVNEKIAEQVSESAYKTVFPEETKESFPSQGIMDVANQHIEESAPPIIADAFVTNGKPVKDQVDKYLIANPIDRSTKDPYGAAAKLFNVKNDYVRGRYRALREKGLVEKQNETNESRN